MFLLHKKYVCRRDFGFWFYSYLRVRKLIRGEAMNREIGVYERKKYPGQFLFGMGFLIGVILPNFIYRTQWRQSTASSMYLWGFWQEITGQSISGRYSRWEVESFCLRHAAVWRYLECHWPSWECLREACWLECCSLYQCCSLVWMEAWSVQDFFFPSIFCICHACLSDWNRFTAVQKDCGRTVLFQQDRLPDIFWECCYARHSGWRGFFWKYIVIRKSQKSW